MRIKKSQSVTEIYPFENVAAPHKAMNFARISIYHPTIKYGKPWPAEISWPSIGSILPDDADLFAKAVTEAVKIATKLSKGINIYE